MRELKQPPSGWPQRGELALYAVPTGVMPPATLERPETGERLGSGMVNLIYLASISLEGEIKITRPGQIAYGRIYLEDGTPWFQFGPGDVGLDNWFVGVGNMVVLTHEPAPGPLPGGGGIGVDGDLHEPPTETPDETAGQLGEAIRQELARQAPGVYFWDPADRELFEAGESWMEDMRDSQTGALAKVADRFDFQKVGAAVLEAPSIKALQDLADQLAAMQTEEEMDGDMSGDDASSTLSAMIETARGLSTRRPK